MRILFVHEVNYDNKVVYEMHEFPELLALRGHEVTFLHYAESPKRRRRSARTRREVVHGRAYPDARLNLVTPPTFGGRSAERYLAPLLSLPALRSEISREKYDVIFLYAVPTTGWQTIFLARRAGVPVVFRALDVSHKIRASPLSPLIRMVERYIYRNATLISANNPAMARYCIELAGRTGPTVVHLPPVDLAHFESRAPQSKRSELGIADDARVVLYMGSFFTFSGLDVLVRGMRQLFAEDPLLHLVLVGGGDLDRPLRKLVEELGVVDRVTFTGVVDYSQLPEYLAMADVAVNPFWPELLTNVAFPHKVLQYMAAGVPAISTSLEGLREVLGDDSGVSWVAGPADMALAASSLAAQSRDHLEAISRRQSESVARLFSRDEAVSALERSLKQLG